MTNMTPIKPECPKVVAMSQELDAAAVSALRTRIAKVVQACVRGELAEDVIQELWLWAWETKRSVDTLTFVELKHRIWDILRCERRHEHEGLDVVKERTVAVGDEAAEGRASTLHDVLDEAGLTEQQKYVLVRRYWFGDGVRDVATKTRLTREAVAELEQTALVTVGCALNRSMQDDR